MFEIAALTCLGILYLSEGLSKKRKTPGYSWCFLEIDGRRAAISIIKDKLIVPRKDCAMQLPSALHTPRTPSQSPSSLKLPPLPPHLTAYQPPDKGFFKLPNELIDSAVLNGQLLALYTVIARHINYLTQFAFISLDHLQKLLQWSRNTVIKHIKALEKLGYIHVIRQHIPGKTSNEVNIYRLTRPVEKNEQHQEDNPYETYEAFEAKLAEICGLNPQLKAHAKKLQPVAEELWEAGYKLYHLLPALDYWRAVDWRGTTHPESRPNPENILTEIERIRSWAQEKSWYTPGEYRSSIFR